MTQTHGQTAQDFSAGAFLRGLLVAATLGLFACASDGGTQVQTPPESTDPFIAADREAKGPLGWLSGSGQPEVPKAGAAVNSYLWRASLDTLSFLPLTSADPFGGIIITDWYAPPQTPDERFKVTVYILDTRLRADGVRVSVFRQARNASSEWMDAPLDPATPTKLENAILARARQLRLAATE